MSINPIVPIQDTPTPHESQSNGFYAHKLRECRYCFIQRQDSHESFGICLNWGKVIPMQPARLAFTPEMPNLSLPRYWQEVNRLEALTEGGSAQFGQLSMRADNAQPILENPIPTRTKRRIYVLHSGMNDPQNCAALSLRRGLLARGIPLQDIIVMDTPYPSLTESLSSAAKNLRLYQHSTHPNSPMVQRSRQQLEEKLQAANVHPNDELIWVGHSAGGQLGLTMAGSLAQNSPFKMDTVITLGTPVATNHAPRDTKVRQYVSAGDGVLVGVNQMPAGTGPNGEALTAEAFSTVLDSNDRVRFFNNIGHSEWHANPAVLDRILKESVPQNDETGRSASEGGGFFARIGGFFKKLWQGVKSLFEEGLGFSFEG